MWVRVEGVGSSCSIMSESTLCRCVKAFETQQAIYIGDEAEEGQSTSVLR